mgnify:CR=1 FL=1|jgi:hypothetical protein
MDYYVIATATAYSYDDNESPIPKRYWWGPFNMSEARHEYDKRQDMYDSVRIVKDVT